MSWGEGLCDCSHRRPSAVESRQDFCGCEPPTNVTLNLWPGDWQLRGRQGEPSRSGENRSVMEQPPPGDGGLELVRVKYSECPELARNLAFPQLCSRHTQTESSRIHGFTVLPTVLLGRLWL
ncbi:hypothetical protein AVEN_195171-1 [Araneus ventricosus]|uniref:Uncharacterized protein n=1 Tax=Araneus ventricosus TaxID=182803 RepID=A0A4Y2T696_ARAVE|nr:hypothetical protein AVEN_195171-1 [Araneus ventricosus]